MIGNKRLDVGKQYSNSVTGFTYCVAGYGPDMAAELFMELWTDTGRKSTRSTHLYHVGTESSRLSYCCTRRHAHHRVLKQSID